MCWEFKRRLPRRTRRLSSQCHINPDQSSVVLRTTVESEHSAGTPPIHGRHHCLCGKQRNPPQCRASTKPTAAGVSRLQSVWDQSTADSATFAVGGRRLPPFSVLQPISAGSICIEQRYHGRFAESRLRQSGSRVLRTVCAPSVKRRTDAGCEHASSVLWDRPDLRPSERGEF